MGMSKTSLFTERQNRLAGLAKALGHPARIAILEYLIQKGSCVCGDIVEELPLSQATISQHLKSMKEAGIIQGEVDGVYRCYCVDASSCAVLGKELSGLFDKITSCC